MKRFGYFIRAGTDDPMNFMTKMRWEETGWGTPALRTLAPVKRFSPCSECLSDD